MIEYYKNEYEEGRQRVDGEFVLKLFQEAFRKNELHIDKKVCKHVLINFLTSLSYSLFNEPERYMDLGKFVVYRSENLHNLLTFQAKDGENALSIKQYVDRGGLYSEELTEVVTEFVENLSASALEEQQKSISKIAELNELSEKARERKKRRVKGENHGV